MNSFSFAFAQWYYGPHKGDENLAEELDRRFRDAWEDGSSEDRIAVLTFILSRQQVLGFDLIVAGLSDPDTDVASHAAAVTSSLLARNFNLGPAVRDALINFGERVPNKSSISRYALDLLSRNEQ